MSCMCGDVMCPSCGPAQGFDPAFETVVEWLEFCVLADMPQAISVEWLAEDLANRLGWRDRSQEFADAVYAEALKWQRQQEERRTRFIRENKL